MAETQKTKTRKRTPILAGNWKMHKTVAESVALVNELKKNCAGIGDREILVCPTFTSLDAIGGIIKGSNIRLGGQNIFWEAQGAFTGEISGPMLKAVGCQYAVIGHSERRQFFGETDDTVAKRVKAAFENNLIPILCVGETLAEREANSQFSVVEKQLRDGLKLMPLSQAAKLVVAYEPVWAIGTGKTASPEQAQEIHAYIRKILAELGKDVADKIRILYGGSIKPGNIDELMRCPDIDGGLIGGASLKAEDFTRIVKFEN